MYSGGDFSITFPYDVGNPNNGSPDVIGPIATFYLFLELLQSGLGSGWISSNFTVFGQAVAIQAEIEALAGSSVVTPGGDSFKDNEKAALDLYAEVSAQTGTNASPSDIIKAILGFTDALIPTDQKSWIDAIISALDAAYIFNLQNKGTTVDVSADTQLVGYINGSISQPQITIAGPTFGLVDSSPNKLKFITNSGSLIGTLNAGVSVVNSITLSNFGFIDGGSEGATLGGGSAVLNGTDALIAGNIGLLMGAGKDTVLNFGTIAGNAAYGIQLIDPANSQVENGGPAGETVNTSALITGASIGILLGGGSGSNLVTNYGTITGGSYGIEIVGAGAFTVDNYGTIGTSLGADGAAVQFGSGVSSLIVESGSTIIGHVSGLMPGDTVDFVGVLAVDSLFNDANVLTLQASGETSTSLNLSPTQDFSELSFLVASDGNGGTAATVKSDLQSMTFSDASEDLLVVDSGNLSGTIMGFTQGDTIDLLGVADILSASFSGNILTLQESGGEVSRIQFDPAQSFAGLSFNAADDDHGGTKITIGPKAPDAVPGTMSGTYHYISKQLSITHSYPNAGAPAGTVTATATFENLPIGFSGDTLQGPFLPVSLSYGDVTMSPNYRNAIQFQDGKITAWDLLAYDPNTQARIDTINSPDEPRVFPEVGVYDSVYALLGTDGFQSVYADIYDDPGKWTLESWALSPAVSCFRAGTRIATMAGEVPIECLVLGELVSTKFSRSARVIWIGYRHINCSLHPEPQQVWPVRVRAGAFGEAMPHRDLWLSPDHAVYLNEVLIPIKCLINGSTIAQEPTAEVTYFHLELEQHDVLLAEGLQAESYLESGDRSNFSNGGIRITSYPDFALAIREAAGCAPLVLAGPLLAKARAHLTKLAMQPARELTR